MGALELGAIHHSAIPGPITGKHAPKPASRSDERPTPGILPRPNHGIPACKCKRMPRHCATDTIQTPGLNHVTLQVQAQPLWLCMYDVLSDASDTP